jgi:DNA-binding protein H-NS
LRLLKYSHKEYGKPSFFENREDLEVARQLALNTIVKWFGALDFDQQRDALGQLQSQHDHSRSAKKSELEMQLAALGFGVPKKRGRPRLSSLGSSNGHTAAPKKSRRGKAKAKYRDPKTKEAWSGRGRMARWLKAKQDAGEKIEKYLV